MSTVGAVGGQFLLCTCDRIGFECPLGSSPSIWQEKACDGHDTGNVTKLLRSLGTFVLDSLY
jgi:hypothetical protein